MSVSTYEHASMAGTAASPRVDAKASQISASVLHDFAAARTMWRELAATGVMTPYQGIDWIESYFRHVEARSGATPVLVVVRDGAGVQMVLPLAVCAQGPVRVARFIGGKHSNFNMPLLAPGAARLSAEDVRAALNAAGSEAGIDLYALLNQPLEWEGTANPMAGLGGHAAPSAGYKLALQADGEALLQGRLSKDARKKLRQKESKLAQLGSVSYRRATTSCEARAILDAFLTLKAARFQTQGIDDPFAGADVRAFLEEAVTSGLNDGHAVVELHALMLDERPVAIYGAVADSTRFCGLFTAFDADPEISRSSPGDILLMAIIRDCCARGLKTFDLGVGEARYKAQVCDQTEALLNSFVPVSLKGRIAAQAMSVVQDLKRWAKHSPQGQKLIGAIRKLKARA